MSTVEGSAITRASQALDSSIPKSHGWTVDIVFKEANSILFDS